LIQSGHKIPFDIAPNRIIEFDFDVEKAELAKTALEAMISSASDDPASVQTPLSAAVDLSTAGSSPNPLQDAVAQVLSIVQEIKGKFDRPNPWPDEGTPGLNQLALLAKMADKQHRTQNDGPYDTSLDVRSSPPTHA
jgi:hypothetical protein